MAENSAGMLQSWQLQAINSLTGISFGIAASMPLVFHYHIITLSNLFLGSPFIQLSYYISFYVNLLLDRNRLYLLIMRSISPITTRVIYGITKKTISRPGKMIVFEIRHSL